MKYIRKFSTPEDREAYMASTLVPDMPYMHLVESTGEVKFSGPEVDYPLYIKALGNLTVKFGNTYEYSKDNVTWTSATSSTSISATKGEMVFFRASGLTASSSKGIGSFTISNGDCNVGGNIMSMVYGADFKGKTEITQTYQFYRLFYISSATSTSNMRIIDASGLALPATAMTHYCYAYMFQNQQKLTSAPALPATTLANGCYSNMFRGCTSLINAPALPATTLKIYCYQYMFQDCTSLVNATALPATTLATYCYSNMFYGCSSLVNAPALPATNAQSNCYEYMFKGCTSLVNAPALPATTLASNCYSGMFYGCSSLVNAPALPATTLANGCYSNMFRGCTSLINAPALPATTLASNCYSGMFYDTNVLPDCSNIDFNSTSVLGSGGLRGLFSGTNVRDKDLEAILPINSDGKYYLPATTLANDCYQYMFYNCSNLVTAPELPATKLTQGCYSHMFDGCTSLVNAPALPAVTTGSSSLPYQCYYYMFQKCTSLVNAPELPATKLYGNCYQGMFKDCSKLNYIKAMFTTTPSTSYTTAWVSGVSASGTFVKNSAATWTDTFGVDAIPEGWTVELADA